MPLGIPDVKTLHSTLVDKSGKALHEAHCEVYHDWGKAIMEKPTGPVLHYSHSVTTGLNGKAAFHVNKGSLLACYHGGKGHLGVIKDLRAKTITMHPFSLNWFSGAVHSVKHAGSSAVHHAGNAAKHAGQNALKGAHDAGNAIHGVLNGADPNGHRCAAYNAASNIPGVGFVAGTAAKQAACRSDKSCTLVSSITNRIIGHIPGSKNLPDGIDEVFYKCTAK